MDVDARDIKLLMWRFFKFSMNTCSTFVQRYPFASGAFSCLLVLYLFLPSVFYFLICSFPVLACTAIFIRFYSNLQPPKIPNVVDERKDQGKSFAKSEVSSADVDVSRDSNFSTEERTLLQRNAGELNGELLEKNRVSSIPPTQEFFGGTDLKEEKTEAITEKTESFSRNVSIGENISELGDASNPLGSLVNSESSSSEPDYDEGAQKGENKALEWTEDDQQNLMDLGFSEVERNKRLESLIARRRARKLFKTNSSATAVPMAPVFVARSNTFHLSKCSADQTTPGSAPSILLPDQNPFDLPYDPLEERPNLMADSFHQEFMTAYQKEMFCRHESFFLGNSFSPQEIMQDLSQGQGFSTSKMHSDRGGHDLLLDHLLSQDGENLRRSVSITDLMTEGEDKQEQDREVGTSGTKIDDEEMEKSHEKDKDAMKPDETDSSTSSSSEEDNEQIYNAKKSTPFNFPKVLYNHVPHHPPPYPIPKARIVSPPSCDCSPSGIVSRRAEEDHFFYKQKESGHTPTNSIASDLQVEVSEVGSPPMTVDGTASSNDEESLTYDGDIDKDITSGSDEMWGVSPHAPPAQEHEESSRQINEVQEEDKTSSMHGDHKISSDDKNLVEVLAKMPSNSSNEVHPHLSLERMPLREDSLAHAPCEESIQKPKESLNAIENHAEEMSMNYDADDTVHTFDELEHLRSNQNKNIGAEDSEPAKGSNSKSNSCDKGKSLVSPENSVEEENIIHNVNDPVVHIKDHVEDFRSIEDIGRDSERLTEPLDIENMPVRGEENLTSTQGNTDDQSTIEIGVSVVNQTFNNPATSIILPELVVDQISTHSSVSSSPKSVLARLPTDVMSSSDLTQLVQTDVSENAMVENLSPMAMQNTNGEVDDSIDHPSIDSISEESTKPPKEVAEEGNSTGEVSDPLAHEKENAEKLRSFEGPEGESQFSDLVQSEELHNHVLQNFEADVSQKVDESEVDDSISNEKFKLTIDGEDESQRSNRLEDVSNPSQMAEVNNSEPAEDTEVEIQKLTEDDVSADSLQPAGESYGSN